MANRRELTARAQAMTRSAFAAFRTSMKRSAAAEAVDVQVVHLRPVRVKRAGVLRLARVEPRDAVRQEHFQERRAPRAR